jgi:integrase
VANIKKDPKRGTYYFVLSAGFYPNGKRRQIKRTGFKTKKEAEAELLKIKNEIINEAYVDLNNVELGDFLKSWLKQKEKLVEKSTYKRYERLCRLYIVPHLGNLKLQKINNSKIQQFIDYLVDELQFSRKTCLLATTILSDVFRQAIKEGIVKSNPVQDIILPKENPTELNVWDDDEIRKFLSIRHHKNRGKYYLAILMALLTGMRKGEILGLTWDQIDFENNVIYITQILESDGDGIAKRTKSKKFRQIMMPNILKEELLSHYEKQKRKCKNNELNLVFCTNNGKRVIPNTLNDVLNSICRKYDLPRIKFHDLRHSHATMLIKQNVNIKIIQDRLGHSTISTTLDIYGHVLPSMQQEVTQKIDELVKCD